MTETNLTAVVDSFVRETDARLLAMIRYAVTDIVNDMQTPVAKGGRMRVDTGFLRASGRGSTDGFPSGNGVRPADAPVGQYTGIYDNWDGASLAPVLGALQLGNTFYWGWVANYAEHRELYDGFMEAPLQNWQMYVDGAVVKVKRDVGER